MAVIERTFHTPGGLALDLSVPAGRIEVETHDGDETHLELECDDERVLEEAAIEIRERMGAGYELVVEVDRRGGGLLGGIEIMIGGGSFGRSRKVRLSVRCPHGSRLAARTASADVSATGRFGALDAKTASGDVYTGVVDGDAAVKTASG